MTRLRIQDLLATLLPFISVAQTNVSLVRVFPSLVFASPVGIENAGDGSNRLFVVERGGRVKVFANNDTTAKAKMFLDMHDSIASGGETGLLGLAFHPHYSTNGYFYVDYTTQTDSLRTVIARFSVSTSDPDSADPASKQVLLQITQPYANHNGGRVEFGPDGFLYIGMGDGGSGGDPQNNAQNRSVLLGKILRLNVDTAADGKPYGIPSDNPFVGNASGYREEIFAYGLRNPWRFSFDSETGNLWCADVGQNAREEIDVIRNGGNYGWRIMEGTFCYSPASGCDTTGLTFPVLDYGRSEGASVTGGFVYHGQNVPSLAGRYVYGDYISGHIWSLQLNGISAVQNDLVDTLGSNTVTSFGVDEQQELYLCTLVDGVLYHFVSSPVSALQTESAPAGFQLFQNYPNPFNPSTSIRYVLPEPGHVSLHVYDPLGRFVADLYDGWESGGFHSIVWDVPAGASGVYYCRLAFTSASASFQKTVALTLVK